MTEDDELDELEDAQLFCYYCAALLGSWDDCEDWGVRACNDCCYYHHDADCQKECE